jgi:hypothetical protein
LEPVTLTLSNGWFAGIFDSDGTISLNATSNNRQASQAYLAYQLSISISSKSKDFLTPLLKVMGGAIYPDRGLYPSFKWYITDKNSILFFLSYIKIYPSRSAKRSRLFLIPEYYELKLLKAHRAP